MDYDLILTTIMTIIIGLDDKDNTTANDEMQVITQNSSLWAEYPQSHQIDELDTVAKEGSGHRETSNYNQQLVRRGNLIIYYSIKTI